MSSTFFYDGQMTRTSGRPSDKIYILLLPSYYNRDGYFGVMETEKKQLEI